MAFSAGYSNGVCLGGFLNVGADSVQQSVAGVTGVYTSSAIYLVEPDYQKMGLMFGTIFSVMFGAFISALMNPYPIAFEISPRYGPTFLLGCLFMSLGAIEALHNNRREFFFTAIANGIQVRKYESLLVLSVCFAFYFAVSTRWYNIYCCAVVHLGTVVVFSCHAIIFVKSGGGGVGVKSRNYLVPNDLGVEWCVEHVFCKLIAYYSFNGYHHRYWIVFGNGTPRQSYEQLEALHSPRTCNFLLDGECLWLCGISGEASVFIDFNAGFFFVLFMVVMIRACIVYHSCTKWTDDLDHLDIYEADDKGNNKRLSQDELEIMFDEIAEDGEVDQHALLAYLASHNLRVQKHRKGLVALLHNAFVTHGDGDWKINKDEWKGLIHRSVMSNQPLMPTHTTRDSILKSSRNLSLTSFNGNGALTASASGPEALRRLSIMQLGESLSKRK
ncbi:hypothetical protein ACHAXM_002858 [Skeletonema potamos]